MEPILDSAAISARVVVESFVAARDERSLAEDVLDGLTQPFKEIPPKHFYDERGAELFDRICELPEYYPTRTERAILEDCAAEITAVADASELVELGSGTAAKTRLLLDAMETSGRLDRYVPLDVTESMVRATATALVEEYPDLRVHGIVGDFERHLAHLPAAQGPRLLAFLGGTIGNFTPGSRRRFLRLLARTMEPTDHLLLGTDLVKDPAIIEAAYNDSAGVTAEFNRNVLRVINRELDGDFDPDAFEHVAFFHPEYEWIEMRLRSTGDQAVRIDGLDLGVRFDAGEEMRTEISAKFTRQRLQGDLAAAGLDLVDIFADVDGLFALSLSRRSSAGS
jgi:L-histidine Nalpha-methyltransferase